MPREFMTPSFFFSPIGQRVAFIIIVTQCVEFCSVSQCISIFDNAFVLSEETCGK